MTESPRVGIYMGDAHDEPMMQGASEMLTHFGIPHELVVASLNKPDLLYLYGQDAPNRGIEVLIAGSLSNWELAETTTRNSILPVISIPSVSQGRSFVMEMQQDSLAKLSTVHSSAENAKNAAIVAAEILGPTSESISRALVAYKEQLKQNVAEMQQKLKEHGHVVWEYSSQSEEEIPLTLTNARVSVVMGSYSDYPVVERAMQILDQYEIPYEAAVVSAHRTPDHMRQFARTAKERGIEAIIAAAGGSAHLPGMIASHSILPVIGIPVSTKAHRGLDSYLSMAQMPPGVATVTVGVNDATQAGLFAMQIVNVHDEFQKHEPKRIDTTPQQHGAYEVLWQRGM